MRALRKLLPYLRPYRWHMTVVIVSTVGVTATNLIQPWLIRNLVQMIAEHTQAGQTLVLLSLGLLGAYLLRTTFAYFNGYVAHIMAWNFVSDLRIVLYSHLQHLSMRYYADRQTGEILSRVVRDTETLEPLIAHDIPDMIVNGLLLVGIAVILFSLNATLALLTLLPMPLLALVGLVLGGRERSAFKAALTRLGVFSAVVHDNLAGIREIQIFTQEQREQRRVQRLSKLTTDERLIALRLQAILNPTVGLISGVGIVTVVWFGGHSALNGTLAVEDLVAFLLYLGLFYQPITLLARINEDVQQALAGAERVVEVLEMAPDVADAPDAIEPERIAGEIVFEQVSFDYAMGVATLHDISLRIEPGQTLALVGPTGAGKTTIASLIPRFYDPTEGRVLLDGIDLRQIRLAALRHHISMVRQDVFLFNGTIRDNIRYGKPNASNDDINHAAQVANAHEFIEALPEGYDTQIGERGIKLSGGQKQRLAIARAVLKDAPILILDEATSAVDTQTEAEIQQALETLMQGRTSIVIAHRLSTVRNADLIAVLDAGRIVGLGTHHELLLRCRLYQKLHGANLVA